MKSLTNSINKCSSVFMNEYLYLVDDIILYRKKELTELKKKSHNEKIVYYIRLVYIAGLVLWFAILHYLKLYKPDGYAILILCIPIVSFIIGFSNASSLTGEIEDELFKSNYLSVGLLLVLPLLTWINKDYKGDKKRFTKILVLAIITTMLSMIDLWLSEEYLSIIKHAKSIPNPYQSIHNPYTIHNQSTHNPHTIHTQSTHNPYQTPNSKKLSLKCINLHILNIF